MSGKKVSRNYGYEVYQFRAGTLPEKYVGTWYWNAGDSDSFCFFIETQSHRRDYKADGKPFSGPVIKTRAEAIRQAKAAAAKLQKEYEAK
jgi:hypothetical protein